MKSIITICLLIITTISSAKINYVKCVGTNAWDGKELVYNNLQTAIDEANDNDSIWIASGTYYPTVSFNGSSDNLFLSITIKKSISLFGGFEGNENSLNDRQLVDKNGDDNILPYEFSNETIFSSDFNNDDHWSGVSNSNNQWKYENTGENSFHVIYIDDKNRTSLGFELNGVTIQGGTGSIVHNGSGRGGGINGNISSKSQFIVQNCIFRKNLSYDYGGAINLTVTATDSSKIKIINNNFLSNSTAGSILCVYSTYKASSPIVDISHNDIINNDGSGLQIISSSNLNVNINSNTFLNNISNTTGGIIIKTDNTNTLMDASINNNSFMSNIGNDGGAINLNFSFGDFNIQTCNNLFVKNIAKSKGGAICVESTKDSGGNIFFENNIVHSNQTQGSNGGAFFIDVQKNCYVTIRSCLISNNYSQSTYYGGAITFLNGHLSCINNLINNNSRGVFITSRGGAGGGLFVNNTIAYNDYTGIIMEKDETHVSIYNNLIVNNGKDLNLDIPGKMRNNITGNSDCFKNPPSVVGFLDGNYDYQTFDFNLISNSTAINNGLSDTLKMFLPSTDLDGKPRIIGDTIDIGAYESEFSTYSISMEDNSNINIFPNPCRRNLYLENIKPSANIAIYNSDGTMVGSFICNTNYIALDLSYLKRGVYFLRINEGNTSYQKKFLKM